MHLNFSNSNPKLWCSSSKWSKFALSNNSMLSNHRSANLPLARSLHCNSQDLLEVTQASLVLALVTIAISINSSHSINNSHKLCRCSNNHPQSLASKMLKFTKRRKPDLFLPTSSACSRNSRRKIG